MDRKLRTILIFVIAGMGLIISFLVYWYAWRRRPVTEQWPYMVKLFNPTIEGKLKKKYEYMGCAYSCVLTFDVYATEASSGSLTFKLSRTKLTPLEIAAVPLSAPVTHFPRDTDQDTAISPVVPMSKKGNYPLSILDLTKSLIRDGYLNQWEVAAAAPGPVRLKVWRKTAGEWEVVAESRVENATTGYNRFLLDPPLKVNQGDYLGFYTAWNPGLFPIRTVNTRRLSGKFYVKGDFQGKLPETAMIHDTEGSYDFKALYSLFNTADQESVSVSINPGRSLYRLKFPPAVNLNEIKLSITAAKGVSAFIMPAYLGIDFVPGDTAQVPAVYRQENSNQARTTIDQAIHDGNVRSVREILAARPDDICLVNPEGLPPLAQACQEGDLEIVELLLQENGVDINEGDASGNTPLHFAAGKGRNDIIGLLISHKATVNAVNSHGDTPLFWAVGNNHINSAKLLLEHGAEIDHYDEYGWDPLHLAAYKRYREMAGILIEKGVEINTRDKQGATALFWAINASADEVVNLLLSNGAEVNITDNQKWTPLHWAVNTGPWPKNKQIIQALLDQGADVQARDKLGQTPLFWVKNDNCDDIVGLLVSKGADVQATNKWGFSVLDWAVENGDNELVKALVSRGAK